MNALTYSVNCRHDCPYRLFDDNWLIQ